jgi:uncharacterized BrkB/YihY/UPF0761 family membrane protein
MGDIRTANPPNFRWAHKRKLALFSICMTAFWVVVLSSKVVSAVAGGALRIPFTPWSVEQPQWLYSTTAVLLLLVALGLFSIYRDWKFRRLTGLRLLRRSGIKEPTP